MNIDGRTALIEFKSMRMSKCSPNSCRICKQIQSVIPSLFQVSRHRNSRLELLVNYYLRLRDYVLTFALAVYASRVRDINQPLRLLVENEIFRLNVWANPMNEPKRGTDHIGMTLVEVRFLQTHVIIIRSNPHNRARGLP